MRGAWPGIAQDSVRSARVLLKQLLVPRRIYCHTWANLIAGGQIVEGKYDKKKTWMALWGVDGIIAVERNVDGATEG